MLVNNSSVFSTTPLSVTGNEEACLRSPHYRNTLVTMFIVVIVLSSIENILLWIGFISTKKVRTIAVTYFISLSVSDFITIATLGWMETIYVLDYPVWILGEIGSYCINAFWCFSLVTPFTHIVFITIDRYRAVTSSIRYADTKSWTKELLKITAIWIYCISITMLFAFHFTAASDQYYEWNVLPEWYYAFVAIHMVLPLIICTALYVKMIHHVKEHKTSIRRFVGNPTLLEFKFARSVGIIIIFLYVVWIPVIAMESVYATHSHTCPIAQLGTLSVWLTCTSGVINPIIFLSKNPSFRNIVCLKKRHFSTIQQFTDRCRPWLNVSTKLAVPKRNTRMSSMSSMSSRPSTTSIESVISTSSRTDGKYLPTIHEDVGTKNTTFDADK